MLAEGEGRVATVGESLVRWVDHLVVTAVLFVFVYSLAMTLDSVARALCCVIDAALEKRRKSLTKSEK